MTAMEFEDLKAEDTRQKPYEFEDEVSTLIQYYEDRSRKLTVNNLKEKKLGLRRNYRPIEIQILRHVIDRLAVAYSDSPTRWLTRDGVRIADDHPDHLAMLAALKRSKYDLSWRRVDRLRALVRQVAIRFYPSDTRRSVTMRVFTPDKIMRAPNAAEGDILEEDKAFAFELTGGGYEFWRRNDEGFWEAQWLNEDGNATEDQPFPMTGNINPFPFLPAMMIYDDYDAGVAWRTPRMSRRAWTEACNGLTNDNMGLLVKQGFGTRIFKSDNPESSMPKEMGPGDVAGIGRDEEYEEHYPRPMVAENNDTVQTFLMWWMLSESLPPSELDRSKQVLTSAALKIQERALEKRKKDQTALAQDDELSAWERFRAVHNRFADRWQLPKLATDTEMQVHLAETRVPMDPEERDGSIARGMALGWHSRVDATQEALGLPRDKAIERIARVDEDNKRFALPGAELVEPEDAPPSDTEETPQPVHVEKSGALALA